ncbi:50S ribosomal protein L24 [Aliikangiella coralliicola]|uniref:Large ribosomal subunit protein uL24 n=1 Tax=Aliikangiella coralliicola TaxID=2592383 RepID=A0A545UEI7_9GAMM|nr:50S ribosomal protein L24 [Aliikangiella coralliicola]TQV87891.1 50S ribosomal protein L24 [Aliikangiella coralliicola]
MQKLKTGDEVIVLTGKSNGQRGKISKIITDKNRVVVEGVNMMKKHVRPNPQAGIQGGIVEKEAAMDISNVAIFNSKTGKADRVGIKVEEDGKRVRIFKSNGELID